MNANEPTTTEVVAQDERFVIGRNENLRDNIPDAALLRQIAEAITANQRDAVFDLAERLVAANGATPHGLLTPSDVERELRISSRSLWRLEDDKDFPKPVRVGGQRRWRATEIDGFTRRDKPKRR